MADTDALRSDDIDQGHAQHHGQGQPDILPLGVIAATPLLEGAVFRVAVGSSNGLLESREQLSPTKSCLEVLS